MWAGGIFYLQSTLERIKVNAIEVAHLRKFNIFRVVSVSILSIYFLINSKLYVSVRKTVFLDCKKNMIIREQESVDFKPVSEKDYD